MCVRVHARGGRERKRLWLLNVCEKERGKEREREREKSEKEREKADDYNVKPLRFQSRCSNLLVRFDFHEKPVFNIFKEV